MFGRSLRFYLRPFSLVSCGRNSKYPDAVGFGIQRKKSAVVYGVSPPLQVVRMRITLAGAILKFHSFAEAVKLRIAALCEKGTVMV